jgi:hypothetical protein
VAATAGTPSSSPPAAQVSPIAIACMASRSVVQIDNLTGTTGLAA